MSTVPDVLLLSKRDSWSAKAGALAQAMLGERVRWIAGNVGDAMPEEAANARPKWLISFLSPWIIPQGMLSAAGCAVNFHPGSCDYPGIGCYNFALYEDAKRFGAVCHVMESKVDSGAICDEQLFDVLGSDSVESLKLRTMVVMLEMFHRALARIAQGQELPRLEKTWSRRPFTRRELNALCRVDIGMDEAEVRRRVRATTYPGYPGAVVAVGGVEFAYISPNRPPLA